MIIFCWTKLVGNSYITILQTEITMDTSEANEANYCQLINYNLIGQIIHAKLL